jgi:hypothetical protein
MMHFAVSMEKPKRLAASVHDSVGTAAKLLKGGVEKLKPSTHRQAWLSGEILTEIARSESSASAYLSATIPAI